MAGRPANLVVNILGNGNDLKRALNQSDSALSKFGSGAKKVGTGIATMWTGGVIAATAFAASVFKTGLAYNTLNQKAYASFKTILGSQAAAQKMMGEVKTFASTSPFPRQAFIEATQQMLSFGIESKKVVPYLGAIQDAVAATGGDANTIGEISSIMSKISSSAKITAEDLNQFGERGVDAASLIGASMGMTAQEVRASITAGSLDAGKALDALAQGMTTKFAGAAANVKATWVGASDRIKGALRDIGSAMAEPFVAQEGGGYAVQWANSIADALRALEPIITGVLGKLFTAIGPQLEMVGTVLDGLTARFQGLDAGPVFDQLAAALPVLGALTGAFAAIAASAGVSLPVVGGLFSALSGPIGIVVAALAGLVATSPQLQSQFGGVLQAVFSALAPVVQTIAGVLAQVAQVASGVLGTALQLVVPLIQILGQVFQAIVTPLAAVAQQLLPQVGAAAQMLLAAIGPLIPIIGELLLNAVNTIMPPLMQIATAAMPLVTAAMAALSPIVAAVSQVLGILIQPLSQLIGAILPPVAALLKALFAAFAPLMPIISQLIVIAVQLIGRALGPLMPALVSVARAITPVINVAAQLIGIVGGLIGILAPLLSIVIRVAGAIAGALVGAISSLAGGAIRVVAGIFQGIAGAISGVVGLVQSLVRALGSIKWPSPPGWLKSVGSFIGLSAMPGPVVEAAGLLQARAGMLYAPTAYAGTMRAAAETFTPSGGGVYIAELIVQAPYGGGDAIARAIRDELQKLNRRERGVQVGGGTRG